MAIYYIDNITGDNSNDGAIGTPWETLSKANATLTAGDIVYIRTGTFNESIIPTNSGSTGNYITYEAYQGETVTITGVNVGANLVGKSYINLNKLRIIESTTGSGQSFWVNLNSGALNHAHHNIIQNCYMEQTVLRDTSTWAGIYMQNTNWNIFRGNTFIGISGNPTGDLISIRDVSCYNLIENNEFYYGTHICIAFSNGGTMEYNVIRNNYITNPYHTGLSVYVNADLNLIDGNIIINSGEEYTENIYGSEQDQNTPRAQHKGMQIGASELIVRRNTFINNGFGISLVTYLPSESHNNRIYHNTFYENYTGIWSNTTGGAANTYIKNNVFAVSRNWDIYVNIATANLYGDYNNCNDGVRFITSGNWTNQSNLAPGFINGATHDFHLATDSALIDAGTFLTQTNGSDTASTTLIVDDSRYFMDGWGVITGDTIQLDGQETTAVITNITGNTLTLDTALTWTDSLGVSLVYSGNDPDLGSNEYTEVVDPPDIPIPTIEDWIEAEESTAVITAPMVLVADGGVSGGYYIHSLTTNSGTAFYTFDVSIAATYRIKASVYVADGGSDSFFVKIDDGVEDIWDIFRGNSAYHGAWGLDLVSYRGIGTWDIPQYSPYTIYLTAGIHTIRFRGRDPGARMDRFYLESENAVSLARGASRGVGRGVLIGVI